TYSHAVTALKAALKTYDRAGMEKAAAGFREVQKRFPQAEQAFKAWVLEPLCEAYIGVDDGNWDLAVKKEAQAMDRAKKVQATRRELYDWSVSAKRMIADFHPYYVATRTFREAMAQAEKQFEARHFDEARLILSRQLRGVSPTRRQTERMRRFLAKVDLTELTGKLAAQIQKADDLVAQNKFAEAEQAYQKAQEMLASEQASILPPEQAGRTSRSIAEKLKRLTENRALRDAVAAVEQARQSGDKSRLLAALRQLNRVQPSEKVAAEMQTIQAELALARGRESKAAGKIEEARQYFLKSLQFKETREARDELALLDRASQRADLISAGDADFTGLKWADALAKYQQAAKLKMDDALQNRIVECQFRIALGEADQLRKAGKYDEAAAAYQKARALKPASAPLIDARLEAMAADRKYEQLMSQGMDALKRQQWAKARGFFEAAQQVRSTAEVGSAIAETRYQENKARGQEAFEQNDYNGALGYFKLARGFKDTPEIRALISQVEAKLKAAGAG
ncbi:MAG: hypothetical protein J7M21_04515, partial [Planctomycetes bacterium]|nr:hypothetical protein [Planctomycetota bacterium]